MDQENNTIVIYHANCLDGFASALCVWMLHPDWEYYPAKHGYPLPEVSGKNVYFLDFSAKKEVIEQMLIVVNSITIIDHHKSSEELKELTSNYKFNLIHDINRSGAILTWQYFHHEFSWLETPTLLRYIEDQDLWLFKLDDTREVNAFLSAQKYNFKTWSVLYMDFQEEILVDKYIETGRIIISGIEKQIEELLANKFRYCIDGKEVWLVNSPPWLASEIGHRLCQLQPFAATYYYDGQKYIFSLRSDVDYEGALDVSEIAKIYGGGGHKHAAGFELESPLILVDPKKLEDAFTYIENKPELQTYMNDFVKEYNK